MSTLTRMVLAGSLISAFSSFALPSAVAGQAAPAPAVKAADAGAVGHFKGELKKVARATTRAMAAEHFKQTLRYEDTGLIHFEGTTADGWNLVVKITQPTPGENADVAVTVSNAQGPNKERSESMLHAILKRT